MSAGKVHKDEDSADKEKEEEEEEGKEGNEKKKAKNTENAAAGDWELPSIFRTIRGLDVGICSGQTDKAQVTLQWPKLFACSGLPSVSLFPLLVLSVFPGVQK